MWTQKRGRATATQQSTMYIYRHETINKREKAVVESCIGTGV